MFIFIVYGQSLLRHTVPIYHPELAAKLGVSTPEPLLEKPPLPFALTPSSPPNATGFQPPGRAIAPSQFTLPRSLALRRIFIVSCGQSTWQVSAKHGSSPRSSKAIRNPRMVRSAGRRKSRSLPTASIITKACASGNSSVMVTWMTGDIPAGVIALSLSAAPPIGVIVGLPERTPGHTPHQAGRENLDRNLRSLGPIVALVNTGVIGGFVDSAPVGFVYASPTANRRAVRIG